jgi:hypothetical protein
MIPTVEMMVKRDFVHILDFVHDILGDVQRGQWGACTAVAAMWVKLGESPRQSEDMEEYTMDRLVSWRCVRYGDQITATIDGVSRTVSTLCLTEQGFELAAAIQTEQNR